MIQQQSKEEINDLTDNLSSKIESAKSLDKRFMEYEKYIHKSAKKSYNQHFEYLKKYSLKKFVDENVDLNEKINDLKNSIKELKTYIKNLSSEIQNLDNKSKRNNRFDKNEFKQQFTQSMNKNNIVIDESKINSTKQFKNENSSMITNIKNTMPIKIVSGHHKTQSCDIFNFNNLNNIKNTNNTVSESITDKKTSKKEIKIVVFYLNQIKELENKINKLKAIRAKLSTGLTIRPKPRKMNYQMPNLNSSLLGISVINKKQEDSNFIEIQKTFLDVNRTNNYDYSILEK